MIALAEPDEWAPDVLRELLFVLCAVGRISDARAIALQVLRAD